MSQRAALLISAALTALILLAGVGLTARLIRGEAVASTTPQADAGADADLDQERTYQEAIDHLQEANAALAASYERIAALLGDVEQLRAQNEQLREREAQYEQRLAEANNRLQSQGQTALSVPTAATVGVDRREAGSEPRSDHERD